MAHKIAADKCVACGCCKDACPAEAISEGTPYVIDADKCVDCGACAGTSANTPYPLARTFAPLPNSCDTEPSNVAEQMSLKTTRKWRARAGASFYLV